MSRSVFQHHGPSRWPRKAPECNDRPTLRPTCHRITPLPPPPPPPPPRRIRPVSFFSHARENHGARMCAMPWTIERRVRASAIHTAHRARRCLPPAVVEVVVVARRGRLFLLLLGTAGSGLTLWPTLRNRYTILAVVRPERTEHTFSCSQQDCDKCSFKHLLCLVLPRKEHCHSCKLHRIRL